MLLFSFPLKKNNPWFLDGHPPRMSHFPILPMSFKQNQCAPFSEMSFKRGHKLFYSLFLPLHVSAIAGVLAALFDHEVTLGIEATCVGTTDKKCWHCDGVWSARNHCFQTTIWDTVGFSVVNTDICYFQQNLILTNTIAKGKHLLCLQKSLSHYLPHFRKFGQLFHWDIYRKPILSSLPLLQYTIQVCYFSNNPPTAFPCIISVSQLHQIHCCHPVAKSWSLLTPIRHTEMIIPNNDRVARKSRYS